jgi:hypothetical protein
LRRNLSIGQKETDKTKNPYSLSLNLGFFLIYGSKNRKTGMNKKENCRDFLNPNYSLGALSRSEPMDYLGLSLFRKITFLVQGQQTGKVDFS